MIYLGTGWKYGESSGQAVIRINDDEENGGIFVMGEEPDLAVNLISEQVHGKVRIIIGDMEINSFRGAILGYPDEKGKSPEINPFTCAKDSEAIKKVLLSMVNKTNGVCRGSVEKIISFYVDSMMISIQEYESTKDGIKQEGEMDLNLFFDEVFDFITNCPPERLVKQLEQIILRPAIELNGSLKEFINQHKDCCLERLYELIKDSFENIWNNFHGVFSFYDEVKTLIEKNRDIQVRGDSLLIEIFTRVLSNCIENGEVRDICVFLSHISSGMVEFINTLREHGILYCVRVKRIDDIYNHIGHYEIGKFSELFHTKIFTKTDSQETASFMINAFNEYKKNIPYIYINYGGKELEDPNIDSISDMKEKDILVIKGSNNAFQGRLLESAKDIEYIEED